LIFFIDSPKKSYCICGYYSSVFSKLAEAPFGVIVEKNEPGEGKVASSRRLSGVFNRVFTVAASLGLFVGVAVAPPAQANINPGEISVSLLERGVEGGFHTEVILFEPFQGGGRSWTACKEWGVAPCDPATIKRTKSNMLGFLLMPACKGAIQEHCISNLSIYKVGETPTQAEYLGEVPGEVFPEIKSAGFPAGRAHTLWKAPGIEHEGGEETYAVEFVQEVKYDEGKYFFNFFTVSVMPYVETPSAGAQPRNTSDSVDSKGRKVQINNTYYTDQNLAWFGDGKVGKISKFAPDTRVSVTVRVPKVYGGWFKGRMSGPDISVRSYNSRMNEITVDASVVEVPSIKASLMKSEWTPALTKMWPDSKKLLTSEETGGVGTWVEGQGAISWVEALRKPMRDTAHALNTVWNFSTLQTFERGPNPCMNESSRVLGIVSTNAATFEGGPPRFERGFLNYQVAGMHFLPDGQTKARGTYDLVMRSDVARCIYGLPKVPVSATVQVVNEKGNKTFATSVVGEKNGWLKLGAYNFTFSKKTIKVKITKAKPKKNKR